MIVQDEFGRKHAVRENYDNSDFEVEATRIPRDWQDLKPTNLLSRNAYNNNRFSTRIDESRGATMLIDGPTHGHDGIKLGTRRYNW